MNVNSLINNQLEESGYLKIIGNFICDEVIDIENNTYYKLDKDDTLSIEIKIKGLNKSELSKGVKNINLDFSLFVRYN